MTIFYKDSVLLHVLYREKAYHIGRRNKITDSIFWMFGKNKQEIKYIDNIIDEIDKDIELVKNENQIRLKYVECSTNDLDKNIKDIQ